MVDIEELDARIAALESDDEAVSVFAGLVEADTPDEDVELFAMLVDEGLTHDQIQIGRAHV